MVNIIEPAIGRTIDKREVLLSGLFVPLPPGRDSPCLPYRVTTHWCSYWGILEVVTSKVYLNLAAEWVGNACLLALKSQLG